MLTQHKQTLTGKSRVASTGGALEGGLQQAREQHLEARRYTCTCTSTEQTNKPPQQLVKQRSHAKPPVSYL